MDCACHLLLVPTVSWREVSCRPADRSLWIRRFLVLLLRPRLPGTFLGLALDMASDKLYDLVQDIPLPPPPPPPGPSAAIVKVMSVPDSRCIRVVTPDDHVNIGFHEVLLHDMEGEDLPFVACE